MTQPSIAWLLKTLGIQISMDTIFRIIAEGHDLFHHEKEDILDAALKTSLYLHIDDTACRVNGKYYHTHILCGPLFTAYFTRPHKDRLTILEIFCRSELKFSFDHNAFIIMKEFGLSERRLKEVESIAGNVILTRTEVDKLLMRLFPNTQKVLISRRTILKSSAINYYCNTEQRIHHQKWH